MDVRNIHNVVVLGQGVMGPDIALGFACAGYTVTGVDIIEAALERASEKIAANCRQMVEGGMITEADVKVISSRITLTLDLDGPVSAADYITEAVPEDMEIKKEVFERCGVLCAEDVIVASNTSSMSISHIASGMRHPDRAITTHWTIPAHLSPMVEVIRGEKTSVKTENRAIALLEGLGKHPVRCRDHPGFIHNYIQFAMVKAALDLLEDGVASAREIDAVVRNGFGLRISSVGPIQFVDMCGLDTILNIQRYMYQKTLNPIYKPNGMIEEKVDSGQLGIKSGTGFYTYADGASERFWEQTNRNIIKIRKALDADKQG